MNISISILHAFTAISTSAILKLATETEIPSQIKYTTKKVAFSNRFGDTSQIQTLPDWLHHTTAGPSMSPILPH
jgi:hypothetical protein